MDLQNHISNFLTYLETQRRFSPKTIDTYRKSLNKFLEVVGKEALLESFSEMQVKSFVWDFLILCISFCAYTGVFCYFRKVLYVRV